MPDILRACCSAADPLTVSNREGGDERPAASFFLASAGLAYGTAEIVTAIPTVNVAAADHESGHVVVGHIAGGRVDYASIRGQPIAVIHGGHLDPRSRAAIDLAGPVAEALGIHHVHRRADPDWMTFVPGVRCGTAGGCDLCRAVRNSVIATRWGGDREVIDWLRAVEGVVVEIVRDRAVWRAVSRIAALLREAGQVDGVTVERVVNECVGPAAMADFREKLK
jgi:hypothetical protein